MKKKILLLLFLLILNCQGNILYWRRLPYYPVQNSDGNFLKIYLPSELTDLQERIQVKSYLISVFQEEKDTFLRRRLLINDDRNLGFNTLWTGLRQFHFKSDCQLIMPISKGEYTYEIKVNRYPDGFFSNIVITENILENHSIVITVDLIEPPYTTPIDFSQKLANRIGNRVRLKYHIEPTLKDDKFHDCPTE
ncbi:hypothetical protein [Leptospira saintgironsiae]|uniref:Uncharacterized protein n=1 Tax=Leptospira saintgironsiae TaxID=2023183 RepID=A0A2M9YDN3_9LEPT|nr:hypothetical protein [Leptospira saintgironsiae]PJZ49583.1 hypothetical protein CH362_09700 [Leptospira saintgironsiae]